MKDEDEHALSAAIGCDDGGDLLPHDAEMFQRAVVAQHVLDVNEPRFARGEDPVLFFLAAMHYTTPLPKTFDAPDYDLVLPEIGSCFQRKSGDEIPPTHEAETRVSLKSKGYAVVRHAGSVRSLVTAGVLSQVEATAIWYEHLDGRSFPNVAVVLYTVGRSPRLRWSYLERFLSVYEIAPDQEAARQTVVTVETRNDKPASATSRRVATLLGSMDVEDSESWQDLLEECSSCVTFESPEEAEILPVLAKLAKKMIAIT